MPSLSDEAWRAVCGAAGHDANNPEARELLSAVLEYRAFDRERWAETGENSRRMLELLDAFADLYRQTWLPDFPVDELQALLTWRAEPFLVDDARAERDCARS